MTRYVNFFTAKGGQGCTVVAAAYALQQEGRVLLVDYWGDIHASLGLPHQEALYVMQNVDVVSADSPVYDLDAFDSYDIVVMDRGVSEPALSWQGENILVTRHCYLALRKLVAMGDVTIDGIVTVGEPGRALTDSDIERVANARVLASVPFDPTIARCVDAGMLSSRIPQNLRILADIHKEKA
jgi:hypothetical protein